MNDLHIQHYPLERLIPYARNARTHADEQISQIAGSIVEFGFVNPILIGDDNVIIAGHGRLMAAQRLGLKTVPVIMLAHLSETQRRALVIADNKIAENAGWDEEMLRLELQALNDANFDLDITGFDFDDLERLLNGEQAKNQGLTDDDAAPEVTENPISQPGDLWLLGDHRVLCGSATVLADVERVIDGVLADMVFTDPPYNVDYGNTAKDKIRAKGGKKAGRTIMNDNLGEGFEQFLYDACVNLLSVCKGAVYVCMSSSELDTLQSAFRKAGGKWSTPARVAR